MIWPLGSSLIGAQCSSGFASTIGGVKRVLVVLAAAAVVAGAAVGATRFVTTPPAAPTGQQVLYGHVKSLVRTGGRWRLRFDPAWFVTGLTASQAKFEDTGSRDVPNDNYVVEEGHRLLTFLVSPSARITVLANDGTKGIVSKPITVSQLAAIVAGKSRLKLFEPLESGTWIRVRIDTILELDQQYQP
jgi:hypothetical protein